MVITKLQGGLGNQMFQYALGRHLAEIHRAELKIDISMFENYEWHDYSLNPFNIQENIASQQQIDLLTYRKHGKIERLARRFLPLGQKRTPKHIYEKYFHFDPGILSLPDYIYLEGYWQSEKYFTGIEEIIRQEFRVRNAQEGKNKGLAQEIEACVSVSLHIRRGNYVSDPGTNKTHGICSLDYYHRCIELLCKEIKTPHFFVFSDDPKWARNSLKSFYPLTIVEQNDAKKDYEDLRLMSQCKHHIIANSTFSWWAAWLNSRKSKLVFCPKKWFASGKRDTRDVIPRGWLRV